MKHDNCLDKAIKELEDNSDDTCFNEETNNIPEVERLACDATFVDTLAGIAEKAVGRTGLCDPLYYNAPVADGLIIADALGHEAVLMAAPFCATTIPWCLSIGLDLTGGQHPVPECLDALPFCDAFNTTLTEILKKLP